MVLSKVNMQPWLGTAPKDDFSELAMFSWGFDMMFCAQISQAVNNGSYSAFPGVWSGLNVFKRLPNSTCEVLERHFSLALEQTECILERFQSAGSQDSGVRGGDQRRGLFHSLHPGIGQAGEPP